MEACIVLLLFCIQYKQGQGRLNDLSLVMRESEAGPARETPSFSVYCSVLILLTPSHCARISGGSQPGSASDTVLPSTNRSLTTDQEMLTHMHNSCRVCLWVPPVSTYLRRNLHARPPLFTAFKERPLQGNHTHYIKKDKTHGCHNTSVISSANLLRRFSGLYLFFPSSLAPNSQSQPPLTSVPCCHQEG